MTIMKFMHNSCRQIVGFKAYKIKAQPFENYNKFQTTTNFLKTKMNYKSFAIASIAAMVSSAGSLPNLLDKAHEADEELMDEMIEQIESLSEKVEAIDNSYNSYDTQIEHLHDEVGDL